MQEKNFTAFEYKTETVPVKDKTRVADEAEAFGWEIVETGKAIGANCTLTMRRDRKIRHRQELIRLEKRAAEARATLDTLERSKKFAARVFCCIFGVFSTLVAGGGMSLVMLSEGNVSNMVVGIILGIVGIALCCINYPVYNKIVMRKTRETSAAINAGEEALANILEQGNDLLEHDEI